MTGFKEICVNLCPSVASLIFMKSKLRISDHGSLGVPLQSAEGGGRGAPVALEYQPSLRDAGLVASQPGVETPGQFHLSLPDTRRLGDASLPIRVSLPDTGRLGDASLPIWVGRRNRNWPDFQFG